jgi:hypothetical protein
MDRPTTRVLEAATHDGASVWQIADAAQGGAQTDTLVVNRSSLRPLQRRASGQGTVTLTFADTSVSGTLSMRGRSMDVDQDFDRPVLASTANMEVALAALPFEMGYAAKLRVFQLQRQKVATTTVRVTGTKTVTVPAGSFETYVLETTSQGPGPSGTIHVRKAAPHHVVQADLEVSGPGGRTVSATKKLTSMTTGDGASGTE